MEIESAHDATECGVSPSESLTSEARLLLLTQRQCAFDADDAVTEIVLELISESLERAEAVAVVAKLPLYTARSIVDQLFTVVAACVPSCEPAFLEPPCHPKLALREEPRSCAIDVTCRHEIKQKAPPPKVSSATPPATPRGKTKRLLTQLSTASALFSSSRPPSQTSSIRGGGSKRPLFPVAPTVPTPTKPVPGVPYSTAPPASQPPSTVSPRKAILVLKTAAVDESEDHGELQAQVDGDAGDDRESADSETLESPPPLSRGNSSTKKNGRNESGSAWSLILPSDSIHSTDTAPTTSTVAVEFVLPGRANPSGGGLPELHRRRSSVTAQTHHRLPAAESPRARFLPSTTESEAVEEDPLGMLGYELRSRLSLSAGVRMQSEDGGSVQTGPELPLFPTKMRRSTFMDASLALAMAATFSTEATSPTKPSNRPSTARSGSYTDTAPMDDAINGVFSLTECPRPPPKTAPYSRAPSTQSLSPSHASSMASSTTSTSNSFRKPSRVARPCTASATCCRDHHGSCGTDTETMLSNNEAGDQAPYTELIKQRAHQRKRSFVHSPSPKKAQSRRSIAPQSTEAASSQSAASPLSRRSLLASPKHDDPLRNATKLI